MRILGCELESMERKGEERKAFINFQFVRYCTKYLI